ncbi:MAG: hypothetical protein ACJ75J_14955 [Cytophagaceae bacterium]
MNIFTLLPAQILAFYGVFLIGCGIVAVTFIGLKAKTALLSGGMSGGLSILTAWLINQKMPGAQLTGLLLSLAFFIVFSWRATKTLHAIFDMIPSAAEGLKGKGIAFLIIGLMAIVSLMTFAVQLILITI